MNPKAYREIALAMLRTGMLGYGGGPAIIPLFRYEAVDRYQWIDDTEFGEILAVANTLPGPIATKMAAYLGYRVKGAAGAISAVVIHILPTTLAMVLLLNALTWFRQSPIVHGMIAAVNPVIVVMLGLMAYDFTKKSWKGLGKAAGTGFALTALLLLAVLNLNPAIVVLAFLAYGTVHFRFTKYLTKNRSQSVAKGTTESQNPTMKQ
ncbi:chromate transporter [Alicyclobacillus sp. SO9]|uniref:chromate transporter n=1 Tax=Alicyclobacillus sp. SO9 TaxID=2665646 RepID=UPI00351C0391